jgi:hypothetical protein
MAPLTTTAAADELKVFLMQALQALSAAELLMVKEQLVAVVPVVSRVNPLVDTIVATLVPAAMQVPVTPAPTLTYVLPLLEGVVTVTVVTPPDVTRLPTTVKGAGLIVMAQLVAAVPGLVSVNLTGDVSRAKTLVLGPMQLPLTRAPTKMPAVLDTVTAVRSGDAMVPVTGTARVENPLGQLVHTDDPAAE